MLQAEWRADMRAIEVQRFGGPEVLEFREVLDPRPGPGQLLVAAAACDVLFVDTMIRSGRGADYFPIRPPYVPGNGMGGTVTGLGEAVSDSWLGRRVIAHTGGAGGGGGYADRAVVDVENSAVVPDNVELVDATAVLHDGTTALRVLETTGVRTGEWVLVLGAAGGMGLLLVQLLVTRGARVIGAVGSQRKLDVVARAGAHIVVNYSQRHWARTVLDATGGERLAVVLDGVGGEIGREAFGLISSSGRFSAHGAASGSFTTVEADEARRRSVAVTTIADLQYKDGGRARLLEAALGELEAGKMNPLIGQTFPLAHAAQAHEAFESRAALGKTLLLTDPK
jgi:NADPH2:quinone reductase